MTEHRHDLDNCPPGESRAHREISGGHRLRHRHDVGLDAEMLASEPGAGAAETGDHFINDEEHLIAVANLAHPREITGRRNLDTMRLHDGLGDEGCDQLWPF